MKRAIVLVLLAALALPVAAVGSASYDRRPVVLDGLYPDDWGLSISRGENYVRANVYPRATAIYCAGVIMKGYRGDSSFLHGGTRYWDKLLCVSLGNAAKTRGTAFILDAKAKRTLVYRKRPINLAPATPPPPPPPPPPVAPPPPPPPPATNCDPNYSPCIPNVPYDLDCADIRAMGKAPVRVIGVDRHRLDADGDGYGCE